MFELKNLRYKDILDIKELYIPKHMVTCIVGQSGSGKTTLIRMLNKLISPDSGDIYYEGENLKELDSIAHRREVVMLPQAPTIFEGDIKSNLLIGLKYAEMPEAADEKLNSILELVHLPKSLNTTADKLSGGEKQRLALGRVLLLSPEVFLLDEPSSALDEETERLIIEEIVDFTKQNNKTLIMVTHSKAVANSYADNIIEIKKGKVVETQYE